MSTTAHCQLFRNQSAVEGATISERYLIESELGKGGIGKIYLARDLTLHHRRVVLKVLLPASQRNPYLVKKVRQEIEALSRIDHHGIVSILGTGKLPDKSLYLAMQYVDGVALRSTTTNEGMDLGRAAVILKQIGSALETVLSGRGERCAWHELFRVQIQSASVSRLLGPGPSLHS